jgi:hypothetical protein
MKALECLTCSYELQLTQKYEIGTDNFLSLLDYDRIDQDSKLKEQFRLSSRYKSLALQ